MDQPQDWVAANGILLRCWDDECAAYEPTSGNTYVVSLFASEIITHLSRGEALKPEQLAEQLADWFEDEATMEDRMAIIHSYLAQIQGLRLVSPVSTHC